MNLTVLGATGMAGRAIVHEAASRGHHVLAASRHPEPTDEPRVSPTAVDLGQPGSLSSVLADADAVVVAVRLPAGEEDRLAPITRAVLDEAQRVGVRVLIVGGAAALWSPDNPTQRVLDDPRWVQPEWRDLAAASLEQFHACTGHSFQNWIYLSPSAVFEPGESTGAYRRGGDTLLTSDDGSSRVSPPDLALAVVDELEHPSGVHHVTVISSPQPAPPAGRTGSSTGATR